MSSDRQAITADGAPAAVGPYSHAVRSGDLLFLSGQTPLDPATGKLVEGSVGDQRHLGGEPWRSGRCCGGTGGRPG